MKYNSSINLLSVITTLCVLLGFAATASAKVPVFVSILPQKYFTEKIGGNLVEVSVMVLPGASPATYEPKPNQMVKLSGAKAYFAIGVPFESAWLSRIGEANKSMRIVHVDHGIKKIPMKRHHHHEGEEHHSESKHEEHNHGTLDPHVWLAPEQVRIVAQNTCNGLIDIDPANEAVYRENLAAFMRELALLDADIHQMLDKLPEDKRRFMVFHPAWGYFAKQYDLQQMPIESEGKEPSPEELTKIIKHGRELKIPVVFVQAQFSQRTAKVIAEQIGAKVVPLNPLAEDWASNMRKVAKAFVQVLK